MKNIMGFRDAQTEEKKKELSFAKTEETPVRSVVDVLFPHTGERYAYYNDLFDLHEGDRVFVDGKLAGYPGIVDSVNTRFKIDRSVYKRVLARPVLAFKGEFLSFFDKMVSFSPSEGLTDAFRSWVKPPETEEKEYLCGEGYAADIENFNSNGEITQSVCDRAVGLCENGKVLFISATDGKGIAFAEGGKTYEVDFRINGGKMTDIYCECPYNGFCKHSAAVLLTLNALFAHDGFRDSNNFAAVQKNVFWNTVSHSCDRIEL